MNLTIISILVLGLTGGVSAIILYILAERFRVDEDQRVNRVEEMLPAANCGGCGYPGCHSFAEACVKAKTLEGLLCPVGGNEIMSGIASYLGHEVVTVVPKIAIVRCNGSCTHRSQTTRYDGAASCAVMAQLYGGNTGCSYGCLSQGDCVTACAFDAISVNPDTMLPEVDEELCTACGACIRACPKSIIELRKKGPRSKRIYVSCVSQDKGALARRACDISCIACGKCKTACSFNAIKLENNLAYIDDNLCRLCRACVEVCPTSAIVEVNFPIRKSSDKVLPE